MTQKERIFEDHLNAFKAKDSVTKTVLGTVKGEIQSAEKKGVVMNDVEVNKILTKFKNNLVKTLEVRSDETTEKELEIVSGYLPTLMSEEDIRKKVSSIIESGVGNMGLIMKEFSDVPCDKKLVSQIVRENLN